MPFGDAALSLEVDAYHQYTGDESPYHVWLQGGNATDSRRDFLALRGRPRESGDRCVCGDPVTTNPILFGDIAHNGTFLGITVHYVPLAHFVGVHR